MPTSHRQTMVDIMLHLTITNHHRDLVTADTQTNKIMGITHHGIIRAPTLAAHGITVVLVSVALGTTAVQALVVLGTIVVLVLVGPGIIVVLVLVGPGIIVVQALVVPGIMADGEMAVAIRSVLEIQISG